MAREIRHFSDSKTGFGWTVCGRGHGGEVELDYVPVPPNRLTADWTEVTCKTCLRGRPRYERELAALADRKARYGW